MSYDLLKNITLCIVGCRSVVQLGGPDPWYNQGGPAKVGARKSFLSTESFLVVKIKGSLLRSIPCVLFCIVNLDLDQITQ